MIEFDYIREFLTKWETRQLQGYIPCKRKNYKGGEPHTVDVYGPVIAQSGVTIGTGLDLGQQGVSQLRLMRIPEELIEKFKPYLLVRKELACAQLYKKPLFITDTECDALDKAVHEYYIGLTMKKFDRANNGYDFPMYSERPKQVQAVTASLVYQYGPGGPFKDIWDLIVFGQYKEAAYMLETKYKKYSARRKDEAKLLRAINC